MRKMVFLCRRRPDITHDEYARRVLEGHVPLAIRHHPTMRHYVVNIVERAAVPGSADLDSVAELSFETLADYRERLYDSPEGEKIIGRDVAGFMGGAHSYDCTEHVHRRPERRFGERTPGVKLVEGLKRKAGLGHDELVAQWLERHVPLVLEHLPGITHYVTNVVDQRISPAGEDFDLFFEVGFAGEQQLRDAFASPTSEGRRLVEADSARLVGSVEAWRVAEFPQK
jgi:hypothetical protein